jgi:hypothetical protein
MPCNYNHHNHLHDENHYGGYLQIKNIIILLGMFAIVEFYDTVLMDSHPIH